MVRKILHIVGIAALMASCSDTWVYTPEESPYLNGEEKTPIQVTALLDAGTASAKTRAADKAFANGDQFVAYLRHVTWEGGSAERHSVTADQAPRLVTFTKGDEAMTTDYKQDITPIGTGVSLGIAITEPYNTKATSNLTATPALYWDDFSNSTSADTDLRTDNHYLQSYYGYCYNGGTPSTALTEASGVLGWTVQTDQNENQNKNSNFQHSDLLWSAEQTPIAYNHDISRGGLTIPFTHAMSKVTVELVLEDGFDENKEANLNSATVILKSVNTSATYTAPTAKVTSWGTPLDVTMKKGEITGNKKNCTYTALIAPTVLNDNLEFAEINKVDGNNYKLILTDAVLTTATDPEKAWSTKLVAHDTEPSNGITPSTVSSYSATEGGITIPGVNYHIKVTLNKQGISVAATITDWEEVSAEGVGTIQFANDVKTIEGATGSAFTGSFDAYLMKDGESGYTKSSVVTWDDEHSKWDYATTLYWPNATDQFKFRALSPTGSSNTLTSGTEVLWGTTAAHNGKNISDADYNYAEGALIDPRTQDVPLVFYHPMSKITINLENKYSESDVPAPLIGHDGAPLSPLNPLVDLSGATIQISNLKTTGTIALEDGAITATGVAGNLFTAVQYAGNETDGEKTNRVKGSIVIPQDILDAAIITITLDDGTTYKAQLNECKSYTVDDGGNKIEGDVINTWQRGKHYIYTITLAKETIKFRALIQKWEEKTGSGNATLEWD